MSLMMKRVAIVAGSTLVSTTATETDPAAWAAATSYTLGQFVTRATTHKVYANLSAGVDAGLPESTPARWREVSVSNPYRMFDSVVNTRTTATDSLTVVLAPGGVSCLHLDEVSASQVQVVMTNGVGGPTIYSRTVDLTALPVIDNWYDYFFNNDLMVRAQLSLTDLPRNPNGRITVTLTGAGAISCGVCLVGTPIFVGQLKRGARAGINDFSVKKTDEFGLTTLTKRAFSKRLSLPLKIDNARLEQTFNGIADMRGELVLFLGADNYLDIFTPLNALGFVKDFDVEITYPRYSLCSLNFEGVI